ncbi:hypothetical protein SLOPH_236 [Spraguea lophii 42_110]|uniref:DNA2/NAM7 helicase-like C-terminal domain-containing protein n=1 Tax=Spraguea lophii (strain 42_110) TaxID=1358809 RepID=S7WAH1_SPRLO|nr:hypothetical protein SLOPH_236 [Spraguea lophii 42_110]
MEQNFVTTSKTKFIDDLDDLLMEKINTPHLWCEDYSSSIFVLNSLFAYKDTKRIESILKLVFNEINSCVKCLEGYYKCKKDILSYERIEYIKLLDNQRIKESLQKDDFVNMIPEVILYNWMALKDPIIRDEIFKQLHKFVSEEKKLFLKITFSIILFCTSEYKELVSRSIKTIYHFSLKDDAYLHSSRHEYEYILGHPIFSNTQNSAYTDIKPSKWLMITLLYIALDGSFFDESIIPAVENAYRKCNNIEEKELIFRLTIMLCRRKKSWELKFKSLFIKLLNEIRLEKEELKEKQDILLFMNKTRVFVNSFDIFCRIRLEDEYLSHFNTINCDISSVIYENHHLIFNIINFMINYPYFEKMMISCIKKNINSTFVKKCIDSLWGFLLNSADREASSDRMYKLLCIFNSILINIESINEEINVSPLANLINLFVFDLEEYIKEEKVKNLYMHIKNRIKRIFCAKNNAISELPDEKILYITLWVNLPYINGIEKIEFLNEQQLLVSNIFQRMNSFFVRFRKYPPLLTILLDYIQKFTFVRYELFLELFNIIFNDPLNEKVFLLILEKIGSVTMNEENKKDSFLKEGEWISVLEKMEFDIRPYFYDFVYKLNDFLEEKGLKKDSVIVKINDFCKRLEIKPVRIRKARNYFSNKFETKLKEQVTKGKNIEKNLPNASDNYKIDEKEGLGKSIIIKNGKEENNNRNNTRGRNRRKVKEDLTVEPSLSTIDNFVSEIKLGQDIKKIKYSHKITPQTTVDDLLNILIETDFIFSIHSDIEFSKEYTIDSYFKYLINILFQKYRADIKKKLQENQITYEAEVISINDKIITVKPKEGINQMDILFIYLKNNSGNFFGYVKTVGDKIEIITNQKIEEKTITSIKFMNIKNMEQYIADYTNIILFIKNPYLPILENKNNYIFDRNIPTKEYPEYKLNKSQEITLSFALNNKDNISLIGGMAGTGKTKLIECILAENKDKNILVCAKYPSSLNELYGRIKNKKYNIVLNNTPQEIDNQNPSIILSLTGFFLGGIKKKIDILIIEDASLCDELDTLQPLILSPNKIILVGDPTFKGLNLFNRMSLQFPMSSLFFQQRMDYSMMRFVSRYFYDGKMMYDEEMLKNRKNLYKRNFLINTYVDIEGTEEFVANNGYINYNEANCIIRIISNIQNKLLNYKIAVLTPYPAQCSLIQNLLNEKNLDKNIIISTFDNFVGKESEVVLISTVRTDKDFYYDDKNIICVALSRAKYFLCIVGNRDVNRKFTPWNKLLLFYSKYHMIVLEDNGILKKKTVMKKLML